MGAGLIAIGIPPTPEEFARIISFFDPKCFLCRSLVEYGDTVLALLPADGYFSFGFLAIWLFFSVFYTMIVNWIAKMFMPSDMMPPYYVVGYQK